MHQHMLEQICRMDLEGANSREQVGPVPALCPYGKEGHRYSGLPKEES